MLSVLSEILFLFLLIILNGVFAMSEIAIVSARKTHLEKLSARGDRAAKMALKLAKNPNQILSTVQVGITLVGIFAGAYGGATLADKLGNLLREMYIFPVNSDAIALVFVVLMITYLSLVIGELVPKRLGLSNPEAIACQVSLPLNLLSRLVAPVVYLLSLSTDFVLKLLFSQQQEAEVAVTRTEIRVLVEQGTESGTIEAVEQDMVQKVLQLNDQSVSQLMTPRSKMIGLDLNANPEENHHKIIASNLNYFIVYEEDINHLVGVAQVNDLLSNLLQGQPLNLRKSLSQPLLISETTKGLEVLKLLKETKNQLALVCNQSGQVLGMVTLNQILEAIMGNS